MSPETLAPLRLIYIGDPMCSWCWGFSPVFDALRARYAGQAGFDVLVGGLRPGPAAEPMDNRLKSFLREEWSKIQAATGQPFDLLFTEREGFLYDTDPASRAVVTARRLRPGTEIDFFKTLQQAFYARNTDITDPAQLARLAGESGLDQEEFAARLKSQEIREATDADYAEARSMGITGFPSLVLEAGRERYLVSYGYQPLERLTPDLDRVIGGVV